MSRIVSDFVAGSETALANRTAAPDDNSGLLDAFTDTILLVP